MKAQNLELPILTRCNNENRYAEIKYVDELITDNYGFRFLDGYFQCEIKETNQNCIIIRKRFICKSLEDIVKYLNKCYNIELY